MNPDRRVNAKRFVLMILGLGVAYASAVWIYAQGVADGTHRDGSAYAANASDLLNAIRGGKPESTIPVLEDAINSGVLLASERREWFTWGPGEWLKRRFGVPDGAATQLLNLQRVAKYRARFPASGSDSETSRRVQAYLEGCCAPTKVQ